MYSRRHHLTFGLSALLLAMPQTAAAQDIDFGDDTSRYAKDGECDDKRFMGTGMTRTVLIDEDMSRDASDCAAAVENGTITLRSAQSLIASGDITWGDDSSEWVNDDECDDPRFEGKGMAEELVVEGIGSDATDCKAAFAAGELSYNPLFAEPKTPKLIHFGDDSSEYANNDQCDDVRFTGEYAATVLFLTDDIGRDASDCARVFESGIAVWQANDLPMNVGETPSYPASDSESPASDTVSE